MDEIKILIEGKDGGIHSKMYGDYLDITAALLVGACSSLYMHYKQNVSLEKLKEKISEMARETAEIAFKSGELKLKEEWENNDGQN